MSEEFLTKDFHEIFRLGSDALIKEKKYLKAIKLFSLCLNKDPKNSFVWSQIGCAYLENREMKMALECFNTSIFLEPSNLETYLKLAYLFFEMGKIQESISTFEKCLEIDPVNISALRNLAYIKLQLNFKNIENLNFFEKYRDKTSTLSLDHKKIPFEELKKEHLNIKKKKRIFIINEDGYGDDIMFARYLILLKEKGFEVSLSTKKNLMNLLRSSPSLKDININFHFPRDVFLNHDYKTHLMSLPYIFSEKISDIPKPLEINFTQLKEDLSPDLKNKINSIVEPKVGVSWSGNKSHRRDKVRSISINKFCEIFERYKNNHFFLIQKDLTDDEIITLSKYKNVIDCSRYLEDFSQTALIVSKMNKVITVDTSLVHLAGTIGIKTNLLLPKVSDWRWGFSGNKTEWYQSVYISRQNDIDDWDPVFEDLYKSLS